MGHFVEVALKLKTLTNKEDIPETKLTSSMSLFPGGLFRGVPFKQSTDPSNATLSRAYKTDQISYLNCISKYMKQTLQTGKMEDAMLQSVYTVYIKIYFNIPQYQRMV